MATTPLQPWSSLTLEQKVQYAKNVSMANNGVSQPNTTAVNATNLNKLITATRADIIATKSLLTSSTLASTGTSAYTTPIPFTSLPVSLQNTLLQYVPPGYSPPTTISGQELVNIEQGIVNSLQALQTAQSTLPKAGAGTSVQPLQPAAPVATQPNNTLSTIATVAAVGIGAAALLNVISNKATPTSTDAVVPVTTTETVTNSVSAANPQGQDPAQRQQAADQVATDQAATTNNITDPAQRAQANQIAIENADNTAPAQVSTFEDPAQRRQANQDIVDTIKYDGGPAPVSPFNDPAQRAQAQQDAIAAETPVTPSQFEDPASRGAALREAIENPGPVSPSNVVDPAQRQQNVIIESEVPSTPSQFEDPSQRGQRQQEEIQNSAPAANPMGQDPAQRAAALQDAIENDVPAANPMGQDPAQRAAAQEKVESEDPNQSGAESNRLALRNTQAGQTEQTAQKFKAQEDWRVRLSLAPGADYLYKVGQGQAGILNPLQATDGVIFPYTPAIQVQYVANYDPTEVTHSNYKFFSYRGSAVDSITITADFTAQDTAEAQYLLAVIHFFRSVTKMFYGKDQNPTRGVPPPLCYLSGLGAFQFDWHPLVINNFTYTLPTDVDYIRAMDTSSRPGVNTGSGQSKGKPGENLMSQRLAGANLQTGALAAPPKFKNDSGNKDAVTYVPTKMSITITANPIVSRNDISNNFSLKEYATGSLLRGSQRNSGGFW